MVRGLCILDFDYCTVEKLKKRVVNYHDWLTTRRDLMDRTKALDYMNIDTINMTYESDYISQTQKGELMANLQAQGRIRFFVLLSNMRDLIRIMKHIRKNKKAQERAIKNSAKRKRDYAIPLTCR